MSKSRNKKTAIHIHQDDNILVACNAFTKGEILKIEGKNIVLLNDIAMAHKIAFSKILKGDKIRKFGSAIGSAIKDIEIGEHVHLHNMKSDYIIIK